MSSRHSGRHEESTSARVVDPYAREPGDRRPSAAPYDRMPPIREGERASSKSYPIAIPEGNPKPRRDWVGSPTSDYDSLSGSLQSLSLINSNTSSVRRDSYSSYTNSERRPSVGYVDDDRRDIDGIYGASISSPTYGRKDSYGSEAESRDRYLVPEARYDDKRDIDGIYGCSQGGSQRRPKQASYTSHGATKGDSRHKKGDYSDTSYGRVHESGRRNGHQHAGYSESLNGRHHR